MPYKAKSRRAKGDQDFASGLPILSAGQRAWLTETITLAHGADHPWAVRLRGQR
ncbi:hypothetical protein [Streptomyces sp. NPDC051286]|uniref:hypothetical protein n=1 Tax=Streptomyces sp. NPDC051286 TaxID=3365647 RepID=UPI00379B8FF3